MRTAFGIRLLPAVLLLSAAALADDTPVNLTRTPAVGDVATYKVEISAQAGGADVTATRTVKSVVKEINKKTGDITRLTTDEGGKVSAAGQEMDIPPSAAATVVTDKVGRMLKYTKSGDDMAIMALEIEHLLMMVQDYVLPDKPVKPGDTWETEVPNPAVKDRKVTIKATYVGEEVVQDVKLLKLKHVLTAVTDAQGAKMTAETLYWVDPANGAAVKVVSEVKDLPTHYGVITMSLKMDRQKAEPAKPEAPKQL